MIHICFCVSQDYIKHSLATAYSVYIHHVSAEILHFHYIIDDISGEMQREMRTFFVHYGLQYSLHFIPSEKYKSFDLGRYNQYILYRLDIANCVDVSKVLYLDVDMIFFGSVSELWNIDLQGNIIGAVMQEMPMDTIPVESYFNSGLLLIDIEKWKQEGISDTVIRMLREDGHFGWPDQDILNIVLEHRWYKLPLEWNVLNFWDTKQVVKNFHFAGMKPWRKESVNPYNVFYFDYLQKTPFYDENDTKLHAHAKRIAKMPRFLSIFIDKYLYLNLYFCKQFLFRLFSRKG